MKVDKSQRRENGAQLTKFTQTGVGWADAIREHCMDIELAAGIRCQCFIRPRHSEVKHKRMIKEVYMYMFE